MDKNREFLRKEFKEEFYKLRKERLEKKTRVNNLKQAILDNAGYIGTLSIKYSDVHPDIDSPAKECVAWLELMDIEFRTSYGTYTIINL